MIEMREDVVLWVLVAICRVMVSPVGGGSGLRVVVAVEVGAERDVGWVVMVKGRVEVGVIAVVRVGMRVEVKVERDVGRVGVSVEVRVEIRITAKGMNFSIDPSLCSDHALILRATACCAA